MRVMLAMEWEGDDPAGWWMSEKLDGVRAVWNGENFVSRNGKVFDAPAWFKKGMPADAILDGELWLGRDRFQETAGIARRKGDSWSGLRFMVFDLINDAPFEERHAALCALELPGHVELVEQIKCASESHLRAFEADVLANGGEGVMLREPASDYVHFRTYSLRKVKQFSNSEAIVIDHVEGTGQNAGRLGALVCEWSGHEVRLGAGLTEHHRDNPPPIGELVTFKFFGLHKGGTPRHPSFVSARDYEGAPATEVRDFTFVIDDFTQDLTQHGSHLSATHTHGPASNVA